LGGGRFDLVHSMTINYSTERGRTEARLSNVSSWELFDLVAHTIEQQFGGCWLEQLDGFEQRYWDLEINDVVLTLHLEHYLGISLFPAKNPGDVSEANSLVETIGAFLQESLVIDRWIRKTQTGCRVLLIGNDHDEGKLVELILARNRNDKVKWTPYTRQMLTEVEQEPPDIILIQLTIPELDGFEIYRQLRKIPALQNVPALLWRIPAPHKVYQRAQRLGIAGCIEIPYTPEKLLAARDSAISGGTYYPPLCTDLRKS
jgi:CheY-like chemotaxis protein